MAELSNVLVLFLFFFFFFFFFFCFFCVAIFVFCLVVVCFGYLVFSMCSKTMRLNISLRLYSYCPIHYQSQNIPF